MDWIDRVYDVDRDPNILNISLREMLRPSAAKYASVMKKENVTKREAELIKLLTAHMNGDVLNREVAKIFNCELHTASLISEGSNW